MELWGITLTGIGAVASLVAALVAFAQARAARQSEKDAVAARDAAQKARDESVELSRIATAAFVRQAEAQEKTNLLEEEARRPPAWSGPAWVSGDLYKLVNTSGRTIDITEYDVQPEGTEKLVHLQSATGDTFEYGDALSWILSRRMGARPQKLTITWRYADEPDEELNQLIIPL